MARWVANTGTQNVSTLGGILSVANFHDLRWIINVFELFMSSFADTTTEERKSPLSKSNDGIEVSPPPTSKYRIMGLGTVGYHSRRHNRATLQFYDMRPKGVHIMEVLKYYPPPFQCKPRIRVKLWFSFPSYLGTHSGGPIVVFNFLRTCFYM